MRGRVQWAKSARWMKLPALLPGADSVSLCAPSASERWQRHVRHAHGSVSEREAGHAERQTERQSERETPRRSETAFVPLSLRTPQPPRARAAEASRSETAFVPLSLRTPQPPRARAAEASSPSASKLGLGGIFTSPRDVEGRLARKAPAYPQAMQLLLGLISSLCAPDEDAGSYALAVQSALRLAEAEFQVAARHNYLEEQAAVARTATNFHELLSSATEQLSQERAARRLVESQDAAMVAKLTAELALERQRREAVQESLRSALAVKRMGRVDAMVTAGVAPAPDAATVAQYEAEIASLHAEVARLNEALMEARASARPEPEPAATAAPHTTRSSSSSAQAESSAPPSAASSSEGINSGSTQLRAAQPNCGGAGERERDTVRDTERDTERERGRETQRHRDLAKAVG